jgi:hypothetical protein
LNFEFCAFELPYGSWYQILSENIFKFDDSLKFIKKISKISSIVQSSQIWIIEEK